jgi:hypothetical protein
MSNDLKPRDDFPCRLYNTMNSGFLLPAVDSLSQNCAVSTGGNPVSAWMQVSMDKRVSAENPKLAVAI